MAECLQGSPCITRPGSATSSPTAGPVVLPAPGRSHKLVAGAPAAPLYLGVLASVLGVLQCLLKLAVQLIPARQWRWRLIRERHNPQPGMLLRPPTLASCGLEGQMTSWLPWVQASMSNKGPHAKQYNPSLTHSVNSARSLPADMSLPRLSSTAGSFFLFSFIHRRTLKPLTCRTTGRTGPGWC